MTKASKHRIPLLDPERIKFIKKIESKKCVFDELSDLLIKGQKEVTKNQVFDALVAREKLGNTCIGNGIAIPKTHLPITNPRAAALVIKKGLKLDAADKLPVIFFLAIIIPEKYRNRYSIMLTTLNQKLLLNDMLQQAIESTNTQLLAKYFDDILYDDTQIQAKNITMESK